MESNENTKKESVFLEKTEILPPTERNKLNAYLLAITLGWAGIHRFYLDKYFTGLMYAFSFGFFGLGILYDLIFLSKMVDQTNNKRQERYKENPALYGRRKVEIARPKWVGTKRKLEFLEFPFMIAFWLLGPVVLFTIYIMLEQLELMIAVLLIMGVSVTIGSVNQLLLSRPILMKTPLLSDVLRQLSKIEDFYFENRPRRTLFYLLYPITVWSFLWSKKTRNELKVLARPMSLVGIALVVNTVLSYQSTFPPYLGISDAIGMVLTIMFLGSLFSLAFLVPTISLSMEMNLSGKIKQARRLSIFPLLIIGVLSYMFFSGEANDFAVLPKTRQKQRLGKAEYRKDLKRITSMFAAFEVGDFNADLKVAKQDKVLTSRVQSLIMGISPKSESAFYEAWWIPGKDEGPWLVVLLSDNREKLEKQGEGTKGGDLPILAANQSLGVFFSVKNDDFPEHMRECFTQNPNDHVFCSELDIRVEKTLLEDRY